MNRYYWDSCCFISRLQRDPDRIEALETITDDAALDKIQIITSTLAIAEVLYLTRKGSSEEKERDAELIYQYFQNPYIYVVQVTRAIAEKAAKIARDHGTKPPDAIHLATAIASDVQTVLTYDQKRMLQLDGEVGVPPLTIIRPDNIERQRNFISEQEQDGPGEPEEPDPATL